MHVKDFSEQISTAAAENSEGREINEKIVIASALITSFVSNGLTANLYLNPIFHASGALIYTINRIADKYSTYQTCKLTEDSRFKNYGLEKYFYESNKILGRNPSRREYLHNKKKALIEVAGGIAAAILPPFGYGISSVTPFVYENNWAIKNQIAKSMEIGDDVGKMIDGGLTWQDVNYYLELLTDKKRICKECKTSHSSK